MKFEFVVVLITVKREFTPDSNRPTTFGARIPLSRLFAHGVSLAPGSRLTINVNRKPLTFRTCFDCADHIPAPVALGSPPIPIPIGTTTPINKVWCLQTIMAEVHTFDPEGDLLLILSRRPEPEKKKKQSAEEISGAGDEAGVNNDSNLDPNPNHQERESPPDIIVHLLVSSKHMILASPVFKAMLQAGFKEGDEFKSKGKVEIELPDDNPPAFIVIMNVVHGRHRRVPSSVDMNLLLKIAVLVDKYQMLESMESRVALWMHDSELQKSIPTLNTAYKASKKSILRWITISWVFRLSTIFHDTTNVLIRNKTCTVSPRDALRVYPIPNSIGEALGSRQEVYIGKVLTTIEHMITDPNQDLKCPGPCQHTLKQGLDSHVIQTTCDGSVSGGILNAAQREGLWPPPAQFHDKWSLRKILLVARSIPESVVTTCELLHRTHDKNFHLEPTHRQKIMTATEELFNALDAEFTGLTLKDFATDLESK